MKPAFILTLVISTFSLFPNTPLLDQLIYR